MMTHNVAFAGVAHIHTPGFVKRINSRSDITASLVWDPDRARAEKVAGELSARVVDDARAIWDDPSVEAAIICSETNLHEALVIPGAAAGKHLFVEKPLGLGAADAYAMAAAIQQAGVRFQTGYFMRGQPVHQFLREQIQKGNFGTITRVRHSNCHAGALRGWFDTEWRWMADPSIAGFGGFGDLGTHSLDILMWLIGQVERVTADIGTVTGRYGEATDESGEGLLHFASGTVGTLAAGWVDVADPVTALVSGTEGHATIINGELYYKSERVEGADGETPWTDLPSAWPHAFELFLDAVVGADPPPGQAAIPLVGVEEAAARSAVMEALYKASHEQAWIEPEGARVVNA